MKLLYRISLTKHWSWLPVVRSGVYNRHHIVTLLMIVDFELDEVVVQDVTDDALELAAGGAQGGPTWSLHKCGC